jgi:glucose-6-phosphate isomerase
MTTARCRVPSVDLALDYSRMGADDAFFARMTPLMDQAYRAMAELEKGALANPDEKRRVGHYWLRAPKLAPDGLGAEIRKSVDDVKRFAAEARSKFGDVLVVGIGGSALGPQLVADALGDPKRIHFLDNTDPDGIARTLDGLKGRLDRTLAIVISKSGGTPETRNGQILAEAAYKAAGLDFAAHAVAVTMPGSSLDKAAQGWLARFPMFDWIGGRTSELSVVGLLPAALQGVDIDALLAGAAACDEATRSTSTRDNPAALMALMWHHATGGKGAKDLVVLPYKDRLLLLSRYLQQLIMESLGKRLDLDGRRVDQGLSVYGNKGSTDQHAYVQQLRDGVPNFFATFIRVLEDGGSPLEVEPGITAGDYLHGFLLGTREALSGNDRASMLLTVRRVDARTVGALIALYERAVGFYATLVNVNAYHQPGVEAGKKAAAAILDLQKKLVAQLSSTARTAAQLAPEAVEAAGLILEHLAANGRARQQGDDPATATFTKG